MTLAPLAASCCAALRPMPSEPPVIRTVYNKKVSNPMRIPWAWGWLYGTHLAVHGQLVTAKETHCERHYESQQRKADNPEKVGWEVVHESCG